MKLNISAEDVLDRLTKYEQAFSQNKYDGKIESNESYIYEAGSIPILLSAPHSVNHFRDGRIKYADMYTGSLVKLIKDLTDCHIVYKIKNDDTDPNYDSIDEDGGYKKYLLDIVDKYGISLFIDLHGASEKRDFDIDIGTNNEASLNGFSFIPTIIESISSDHGLTNVGHNRVFDADRANNITNNVGTLSKIPAMQLEMNREYRDFFMYPENQYSLVNVLFEIVQYFKDFDWEKETYVFEPEISNVPVPMNKVEFSQVDIDRYNFEKNDLFSVQSLTSPFKTNEFPIHFNPLTDNPQLIENKVYLTTRVYRNIFGQFNPEDKNKYVLIQKTKKKLVEVGIPKVGMDYVFFGTNLIKELDLSKKYLIYNRFDDISYPVSQILETEQSGGKGRNKIFLDYYHRQLMNINIPKKIISCSDYDYIYNNPILGQEEKALLELAYDEDNNYYILNKSYKNDILLCNIFKKLKIDLLELVESKKNQVDDQVKSDNAFKQSVLTYLINSKKIKMRTGRPYPTDEASRIIRLTPNTMKILGVNEHDKVLIEYENKKVNLRVMVYDSIELIQDYNPLTYDESDANLIIGIPAKYRYELGMYSINSVVTVSRDMDYILVKNANSQILPIIAVIFTIIQTFESNVIRLILSIILIPVAIYINLSEERERIDRV